MMENKTKIDLKNKSIFITGVAGFIGSNLAKRLLSTVEGVKVVGLDNMNHYYDVRLKEARLNELEQFENFSFVKGNLADKAVIESIFEQYKPEIVVNLGAQAGVRYSITNPDAYVEANLIGFYIKVSDAQRWMIKLQKEGKGYSTLTSIRGVVKPAFQMAYNEEVVRRNPFDFKLTDVVVNDRKSRFSFCRSRPRSGPASGRENTCSSSGSPRCT